MTGILRTFGFFGLIKRVGGGRLWWFYKIWTQDLDFYGIVILIWRFGDGWLLALLRLGSSRALGEDRGTS